MSHAIRRLSSLVVALTLLVSGLRAAAAGNPVGKIFVASTQGDVSLNSGDKITPLDPKASYPVQGSVIETRESGTSVVVFSNGSGVLFGPKTRAEVKQFSQAPFSADRTDTEMEPSISNTNILLSHGSVALCTSRLAAGSTMNYTTPHAVVNIRGRRVLIEATEQCTKISLLDGDVTVRGGGEFDVGGQILKPGQQAVIPGAPVGVEAPVAIRDIPEADRESMEKNVAEACMARNTVFFDIGDLQDPTDIQAIPTTVTDLPPTTVSNSVIP